MRIARRLRAVAVQRRLRFGPEARRAQLALCLARKFPKEAYGGAENPGSPRWLNEGLDLKLLWGSLI